MMMAPPRSLLVSAWAWLAVLASLPALRAAVGEPAFVSFSPAPGAFPMVQGGAAAPIWVAESDWPGVKRVAGDLQADIERVSGIKPTLSRYMPNPAATVVVIGTIGRCPLIDRLMYDGKLDAAAIRGKWESWIVQTIDAPFPGIARALVIAGSDKRGTIFGVYDLSEQMGVSPWYWWADVPTRWHAAIYVDSRRIVQGPPAVKYRGIFLNDERPDLPIGCGQNSAKSPCAPTRRSRRASPITDGNSTPGCSNSSCGCAATTYGRPCGTTPSTRTIRSMRASPTNTASSWAPRTRSRCCGPRRNGIAGTRQRGGLELCARPGPAFGLLAGRGAPQQGL